MPDPHFLQSAVRSGQRQILASAERAGDRSDAAVHQVWRELLQVMQRLGPHRHIWPITYHIALRVLKSLEGRIVANVTNGLLACAADGTASAFKTVRQAVPAALAVREAIGDPTHSELFPTGPFEGFNLRQLVRIGDELRPREIVFDAIDPERLHAILHAGDWQARLSTLTKLAPPETLATMIANGFQDGLSPQQIARDVQPHLENVRASARRLVRTEGVRIGHDVQMEAWESLGDAVIGYQIHSAHRTNTRWWHAERDGTIYYKKPGEGQKGLDQMPRPPMEAADPTERPPNTPQIAPNCLCWLSPVFAS